MAYREMGHMAKVPALLRISQQLSTGKRKLPRQVAANLLSALDMLCLLVDHAPNMRQAPANVDAVRCPPASCHPSDVMLELSAGLCHCKFGVCCQATSIGVAGLTGLVVAMSSTEVTSLPASVTREYFLQTLTICIAPFHSTFD